MGTFVIAALAVTLRSISISPPAATIAPGATTYFMVIGTYSDGARKDVSAQAKWSSSDGKIATMAADGTVKALAPGTVGIKAAIGKTVARAKLTVQPHLPAVRVSPVPPQRVDPEMIARMVAQPPPPQPVVEPPPEPPQPEPVRPPVLRKVVIDPPEETLPEGKMLRLTARALYSDGSVRDITREAVWASTDIHVAEASYGGTVIARRYGTATIAATLDSYSGVAEMTVTPVIARIDIRPHDYSVRHRATRRIEAVAILTDDSEQDITDRAKWSSSDERVASIGDGSITGNAPGWSTITVTFENATGSAPVEVKAVVVSIAIQPQSASLTVGQGQQLTAMATLSDGGTRDVSADATWSSDSGVVSTSGSFVTAMMEGTAVVRARVDSVEGQATISVSKQ